jgi:hypothetical protein
LEAKFIVLCKIGIGIEFMVLEWDAEKDGNLVDVTNSYES